MTQELIEQKSRLQNEMSDYLNEGGNLALQWATGVGKSRVAVNAVMDLFDQYGEEFRALIVVAEDAHKDNWKEEFRQGLNPLVYDWIMPHVHIICYASLKNWRGTKWDLIVFDEAHHLQSDTRKDILQSLNSPRVLAMSATLKEDVLEALTRCFGRFEVSKITLQDAIDKGFLPEPKIVCIPLELERFKRTETIEMDLTTVKTGKKGVIKDLWSNRWKYLKHRKDYAGYVLQLSCTQKEKYEYINEQFGYWKKRYFEDPSDIRVKYTWLQWGSVRKRYLGELKTKEAGELCKKLEKQKKRFICFCSSILQAEALGGKNCIHSKKKDIAKIISEFNNGGRNSIFAVGMLQEGQNLNNIQAGIIVQLDGEERGFIQKFGRSLRAEDPVQYILYYKNTKDKEYLQKALEGIDKNYIQEI
mgnify:FL=1